MKRELYYICRTDSESRRDGYLLVTTRDLDTELLSVRIKVVEPLGNRIVVVAVLAEVIALMVILVEAEALTRSRHTSRTLELINGLDTENHADRETALLDRRLLSLRSRSCRSCRSCRSRSRTSLLQDAHLVRDLADQLRQLDAALIFALLRLVLVLAVEDRVSRNLLTELARLHLEGCVLLTAQTHRALLLDRGLVAADRDMATEEPIAPRVVVAVVTVDKRNGRHLCRVSLEGCKIECRQEFYAYPDSGHGLQFFVSEIHVKNK